MARKRVIDPSFFQDGELSELPAWARLFYIGLWTQAEDSGCLSADAKTHWKALMAGEESGCKSCGVAEPVTIRDVAEVLDRLEAMGKLLPYEVANGDGKTRKYLWLVNFHRWQRVDYPSPPKIPLPDFITWHGEDEFATGRKGTADYKPNRRQWHYQVHRDLRG